MFWIFTVKLNYRFFLFCFSFPCRKACFLKQWTSHPERVAERWPYLPGPPPRMVTGEDAHGDHGCQTLFPWCQGWLVSWIRTVLSDSTGGVSAAPGRRHTGRMWNVTEQGHCKGHRMTCHPPPPPNPPSPSSRNLQPGLVLHVENIRSEFILCLSLSYSLCVLSVRLWWICRQQCPGLKSETARTPLLTADTSVNSLLSLKFNCSGWRLRNQGLNL